MKMDETAWRAGYLAGMKKERADSNPYCFDDDRGLAWASGYIEGTAKPDKLPQMRPTAKGPTEAGP